MRGKRDDSLSNRDNCIQKERQIYFEFLTIVASSVKLMLVRACSNYRDLDIRCVENWLDCQSQRVVQSPARGVCQVLIQEHDLTTGQIASSVRSSVILSQGEQSISSRAGPSCTGPSRGWRSDPTGTLSSWAWDMQSPAPGEGQPRAPVEAGGSQLESSSVREGPGGPGGQQGDHEAAAPHSSRGDQHHPGLHEQERSQPSSLCSLCSVLDYQPHSPWAGLPYPSIGCYSVWQFPFGLVRCGLCSGWDT